MMTTTYGRAKAGWPARTYIQQLCEDTGCGPEDLPEAMNNREKWRERVRDIGAGGTTWWWWLLFLSGVSRTFLSILVDLNYEDLYSSSFFQVLQTLYRGCPRGVMVKAMDCGIVVSEFVLQSRYYVHFRANTLGKGMNPLILPAMG